MRPRARTEGALRARENISKTAGEERGVLSVRGGRTRDEIKNDQMSSRRIRGTENEA